jgi:hypothetical protein
MSRAPRLAAAGPFLSDGESFKLALARRLVANLAEIEHRVQVLSN